MVLVGVAGMDLDRKPFYEKEISFSVSCSYGPGRYDKSYEGSRIRIIFRILSGGRPSVILKPYCICSLVVTLMLTQLITHRHDFEESPEVYAEAKQIN